MEEIEKVKKLGYQCYEELAKHQIYNQFYKFVHYVLISLYARSDGKYEAHLYVGDRRITTQLHINQLQEAMDIMKQDLKVLNKKEK